MCVCVCVCVATHESLSVALTSPHVVSACVHSTETGMSRQKSAKCSVITCIFEYGALKMNYADETDTHTGHFPSTFTG